MISEKKQGNENISIIISLLWIIGFILLGSFFVYGLNTPGSRFIYYSFISLFFLFYRDIVFSIALIFILILNPWGLFYTSPYNWMIGITSTVGVPYFIVLAFSILIKYMFNGTWKRSLIINYFGSQYKYFVLYTGFLLLWGLAFGHSSKSIYDLVTTIIIFSMFYVLTRTFDERKMHRFNQIIFGFCLIHTFISTIDIITNGAVSTVLVFGRPARGPEISEGLVRIFGGIWIALYSLVISLYYLLRFRNRFNYYYLLLVIFSSGLSLINSATRGWILGSGFLILGFLIISYFKSHISLKFAGGTLAIIFISVILFPGPLKQNIEGSFERFSTVKYLAEGDLTAGGTAGRWDIRGPRVLERFKESPVFGYGFSKITSEYFDPHVGNHTLLLIGGLVGLVIIFITVLKIVVSFIMLENSNKYFFGLFIFSLGLLSILVIHSTNMIMISYIKMPVGSALVIALLLNNVNAQVHTYISKE